MDLLSVGPPFSSEMAPALRELLPTSPIPREESAVQALGPIGQGTWEVSAYILSPDHVVELDRTQHDFGLGISLAHYSFCAISLAHYSCALWIIYHP